MYLPRLVKGCQLNGCDATAWYTEKVTAVAKGAAEPKDDSTATRPATSRHQRCQVVRSVSPRDEVTDLAVVACNLRRFQREGESQRGIRRKQGWLTRTLSRS